jgi:hypothetical protein
MGRWGREKRMHRTLDFKTHARLDLCWVTILGRADKGWTGDVGCVFTRGGCPVRREFNILALIKGQERFVFVYDDASRPDLIDVFRDCAADPGQSFNWFDAAVLTEKAREQARGPEIDMPSSRSRI